MSDSSYEAFALRYWSRNTTSDQEFFRMDLYGDPVVEMGIDYSFWVLRNAERTVLVDCGFHPERTAALKGRVADHHPEELLDRIDVRPKDVDHVILTHMHYDHIGNVGLFPNAMFTLARAERDFWAGPSGDRELTRFLAFGEEKEEIERLIADDRIDLMEEEASPFLGIIVTRVGGHTPGQVIVEASTQSGRVVLASDAVHFYEELERDRPYNVFTDLGGMYSTYDRLRALQAEPHVHLVAGHDPRVRNLYPEVAPDIWNITTPRQCAE